MKLRVITILLKFSKKALSLINSMCMLYLFNYFVYLWMSSFRSLVLYCLVKLYRHFVSLLLFFIDLNWILLLFVIRYEKGAYMFGRVDLCDFMLEHPTISRFHAGIWCISFRIRFI